jgi:hypothetical protein
MSRWLYRSRSPEPSRASIDWDRLGQSMGDEDRTLASAPSFSWYGKGAADLRVEGDREIPDLTRLKLNWTYKESTHEHPAEDDYRSPYREGATAECARAQRIGEPLQQAAENNHYGE